MGLQSSGRPFMMKTVLSLFFVYFSLVVIWRTHQGIMDDTEVLEEYLFLKIVGTVLSIVLLFVELTNTAAITEAFHGIVPNEEFRYHPRSLFKEHIHVLLLGIFMPGILLIALLVHVYNTLV